MKTRVLLAAAALGVASLPAFAVDLPGPVVDTAWLAQHRSEVQVVDVRSDTDSYTAQPKIETEKKTGKKVVAAVGGHIPDSMLVDFGTIRTEQNVNGIKVKYMLPSKEQFERLVQAAGIQSDKPIVLVPVGKDVADVDEALRMYWQLKVYGEEHVAVLDGGMAAWLAEGRDVTTSPAPRKAGNWASRGEHKELVATSDDVAQASSSKAAQLVDSRPLPQYHGLSKRDYVFALGHVAGAKPYAPELLARSQNGALHFYSAQVYRNLFLGSDLDAGAPSITYCNSGHLAAGAWFVMSEIVGNRSTKLYDGSMHLWTLEHRPVSGVM
ncbi:MAG TPA: rhodanese-like domain-containing protein [Noviherbaspirillum sp.]|uniref:sulfurtransferase n=1 Tax=Noviherbaspirillum sp. TaxID=1926288 RepID=UPI002B47B63E|nr:rhodanese-like domain-containing protein [Noviherbaspirillum sp.]HJV85296.1 rhodanese-like domain-containing protein [Noviherbaspirillum sp.]